MLFSSFTVLLFQELNKLNQAPGDFRSFLTAADSRSLNGKYDLTEYWKEPDYKFWFDFDFYGIDNHYFHASKLYPFNGGELCRLEKD